jgi:hypothetical protein
MRIVAGLAPIWAADAGPLATESTGKVARKRVEPPHFFPHLPYLQSL